MLTKVPPADCWHVLLTPPGAISKLSRPYPSAARVTEQMCESSLFKSRIFPFEVAVRSVCRRLPQQHCLSPSACYYVMAGAMSCDTLPLCAGGGGWGVGRWGCVCECVCGSPVRLDQNLAWHMLPTTAGMKYIGPTFIVGKISTGGRCTICKD